MNRRDMMKLAATQTAMVALPAVIVAPSARAESKSAPSTLKNAQFELSLTPGTGLSASWSMFPRARSLPTATTYSFGTPVFSEAKKDGSSIVLHGKTDFGLAIQHRFTVDPAASWIEEVIEFTNTGSIPLDLHNARSGFVLPLQFEGGKVEAAWAQHKLIAIPFGGNPTASGCNMQTFPLHQILTGPYSSELWTMNTTVTPGYAAEGWAWTDGKQGFLISKFSPGGLEFAVLDRVASTAKQAGVPLGRRGHLPRQP